MIGPTGTSCLLHASAQSPAHTSGCGLYFIKVDHIQRILACGVQVDLTKVWLTMSSIIVALSFSFSNSIMNLFNSVILLFVVHPFDVGDALLIPTTTTGSGAAEYCVVEELSLVVTTLANHFLSGLLLTICVMVISRNATLTVLLSFCMHFPA